MNILRLSIILTSCLVLSSCSNHSKDSPHLRPTHSAQTSSHSHTPLVRHTPTISLPHRQTATAYYNSGHLQEAIWIADENGETHLRDQIKGELERRLIHESYEELSLHLGGLGQRAFLRFQSGIMGIFKPNDDRLYQQGRAQNRALYTSEIAAYRLDQLLGLNIVPLTIPFQLQLSIRSFPIGTLGSLQIMVDREGLHMEIGRGITPLSEQILRAPSFQAMEVLDYISGNVDRTNTFHNDNWIYWPAENRVIAIDHGIAFQDRQAGCFAQETNSLYWGFKDPIRASVGGLGVLTIHCRLQDLRMNGVPTGQLLPGILDEVQLRNLPLRIVRNLVRITAAEFNHTLLPFVENSNSCVKNRQGRAPEEIFRSTGCLDLAWERLVRVKNALLALELEQRHQPTRPVDHSNTHPAMP